MKLHEGEKMDISNIKQQTSISKRFSNIELLRIVSMVMIVAHHFAMHGGFAYPIDEISFNRIWIQFLQIGGKVGVDIYVIISGYFLIDSPKIRGGRLVNLWFQIVTFSAGIYIVFVAAGIEEFNVNIFIECIFPITFCQYWFASTYFILYLLSPWINKFLLLFDKATYRKYLAFLGVLWCVLPTLTNRMLESNALLWFIVLYSAGAYINKYGVKLKGIRLIIYGFVVWIGIWMTVVISDVIGTRYSIFTSYSAYFYEMQKLPIVAVALLLFVGFANLDVGYCRWINLLASLTFGIYLLHDNYYIRMYVWENVLHTGLHLNSNRLVLYSMAVILGIYCAGSVVEFIRKNCVSRIMSRFIERCGSYLDIVMEKWYA